MTDVSKVTELAEIKEEAARELTADELECIAGGSWGIPYLYQPKGPPRPTLATDGSGGFPLVH
jgi:hypothetical protein